MLQQKATCTNCGAELLPDARFCRRCGQPSNPLERGSVTEVTTRRLETPGQPFMLGQNVTGQQSLEQQSSGQSRAGLSAETRRLAPASPLKRWLPGLVLLCIAILLLSTFLIRALRHPTIKIVPPTAQAPAVPQPPKPPQPPATWSANSKIDPAFIYPGARTTMVISKPGGGDMVQLQTDDSLDKVAGWYTEKLKPTEIVRQPGSVILKAGELAAIITGNGGGSSIMLKQGAD